MRPCYPCTGLLVLGAQIQAVLLTELLCDLDLCILFIFNQVVMQSIGKEIKSEVFAVKDIPSCVEKEK